MSARRKARKRALDLLYASDLRQVALGELIGYERERTVREPNRAAIWQFAEEILAGVQHHRETIDQILAEHSSWPLDRMPTVDRALARIAVWEILHQPATPTAVIISEAGELASEYSTEDSRAFIQGLLGTIAAKTRPQPSA